jgi:hypothetical protein
MVDTNDTITDLAALRSVLGRLGRTRDPVDRDRLAVQLIAAAPRILRDVRRQAARDAIASGMRAADYARSIGVSRGAVDHLLHRGPRHRQRPAAARASGGVVTAPAQDEWHQAYLDAG